MGRMQRTKGKVFERWVAQQFREAYPFLDGVRRSQQGAGAEQSDVTGVPGFWIECQDAARPTPLAKLAQAERDLDLLGRARAGLFPIAVVHRSGTAKTSTQVTLRLSAVWHLSGWGYAYAVGRGGAIPVSMALADFLVLAEHHVGVMHRIASPKSAGAPGATPQARGARRDRKETNR